MKLIKITKYISFTFLAICIMFALSLCFQYLSKAYYIQEIQELTDIRQQADKKNKPLVSVILPTYNRQKLLKHAISSILAQTLPDFELIIINDGSKDNTAKIIYQFMLQDKRIIAINHKKNKGLISGLNEGLKLAKGKYIARMDDDDFSMPERIKKQVEFLENNPDITLIGTFVTTGDPYIDKQWATTNPDETKILHYIGLTPVCHPAIMVRSDFLKQHNIKYKNTYIYAEDRPFYGDILDAGGKISNVPYTLFKYTIHTNNSEEYYAKQSSNVLEYHLNYINKLMPVHIGEFENKCTLLKKIKSYSKKHGSFQLKAIKKFQEQYHCLK